MDVPPLPPNLPEKYRKELTGFSFYFGDADRKKELVCIAHTYATLEWHDQNARKDLKMDDEETSKLAVRKALVNVSQWLEVVKGFSK